MAEGGARTGSEHSGHPAPARGEHPIADRVHAAMYRVQPTPGQTAADRTTPDPELAELVSGDNSVLALGKLDDRQLRAARRSSRGTFGPYMGLKGARVGDGADNGGPFRAGGARSVTSQPTT